MHLTTSPRLVTRSISVVLAIVLAALMPWAPAASAYQHVAINGQPGAVQPYATLGVHHRVACPVTGYTPCYAPGLVVAGPTVYRSPASSGTQYLTVQHLVYSWNGTVWVEESTKVFSGSLAAGQSSATFPDWSVLPRLGGHKSTVFAITWSDSSGLPLGTSVVVMNGNDYICSTQFVRSCTASSGYVTILRP